MSRAAARRAARNALAHSLHGQHPHRCLGRTVADDTPGPGDGNRLRTKDRIFTFDGTSLSEEYRLEGSAVAKEKTYAELDARYPEISEKLLLEIQGLLSARDAHVRGWAVQAMLKIGTPAAIEVLLDRFLAAPVPGSFVYEEGLKRIGPEKTRRRKRRRSGEDRGDPRGHCANRSDLLRHVAGTCHDMQEPELPVRRGSECPA